MKCFDKIRRLFLLKGITLPSLCTPLTPQKLYVNTTTIRLHQQIAFVDKSSTKHFVSSYWFNRLIK